jgi:hypothetical protein
MRMSILGLVFIVSVCPAIVAKGEEAPSRKIDIYIETSYVIPSNEAFRANYDRTLFSGSSKTIPLSLGLGGQYYFNNTSAFYFELKRFGNRLSTSDKIDLAVLPIGLGYRFYFFESTDYRTSLNFGPAFYWVTTSVSYTTSYTSGITLVTTQEEKSETKSYFGIGLNCRVALEQKIISRRNNLF